MSDDLDKQCEEWAAVLGTDPKGLRQAIEACRRVEQVTLVEAFDQLKRANDLAKDIVEERRLPLPITYGELLASKIRAEAVAADDFENLQLLFL